MIVCPNCNYQNPDGAKQCENCSTPLPDMTSCPNCGATVQTDATFCGQCGYNLQAEKQAAGEQAEAAVVPATAVSSPPDPLSGSVPELEPVQPPVQLEPLVQPEPLVAAAISPEEGSPSSSNPDLEKPVPVAPIPEAAEPQPAASSPAPTPAGTAGSSKTQLQVQTARLLHVQSNTLLELPQGLLTIHIGKPNDRVPPDIDVSGFPNSEVVSRIHADIRVEGDSFYIEDAGSSNGTYINSLPLPKGNRHRLRPGDRIALGKGDMVTFLFQLS